MIDKGAHFHKCDFQVHTPRDLNWHGLGATTDEERKQYAREFVQACRTKGLDAVAITDHHDICSFKYIREAAESETDDLGNALPREQRLTVFPGMELTLAVPCQALLILDAEFPVDLLPQVVQALSVTAAPDKDAKHAEIHRLEHIKTLQDLYAELNKREFLKGRFIVFPHVGDGGNATLLRSGFAEKYKSMPCVGGFVDGSVTQHGTGNKSILDGRNKDYGNKAIAVLQTSDSRSRDFSNLGKHVTWIKWAEPTAEALRQACLARYSRISHTEPVLPSIRLDQLEVSNSKFLGPLNLDFNPQYNAIIGGRGTGKSSILEYIRWALCDQPPTGSSGAPDDALDFQRRRQSLIDGTLIPLDAVVDVSFLVNDVAHVVRRKASGELSLKIGDGPFQQCTQEDVRELLPIRAYSQKQLSAVGARVDELRRFVQAPIQSPLDGLNDRIRELNSRIRTDFERVVRCRSLRLEIAAHDIERQSLKEQIEKQRSSLKGLSGEDQAIIAGQGKYEEEARAAKSLQRDVATIQEAFTSAASDLGGLPSTVHISDETENQELLERARSALANAIAAAREQLATQQAYFTQPAKGSPLATYFSAIEEWEIRRQSHDEKYEAAKARSASHEETLQQIQQLEGRLVDLNATVDAKSQQLTRLGDPGAEFANARSEWRALHKERGDLLEMQCKALTALAKSRLRAILQRAGDTASLAERLRQLAKGTKIRGERFESVATQISVAPDPFDVWNIILDELMELAWVRVEDESATPLPTTPRLDAAGFTLKEKISLARQLQPALWLDLLLFDLKDVPVFQYQVREDDFLPFENASPGQQATALLSILLLQEGPPLIIDQPEDDLNMRVINDIVETLWQAKKHRQLIFSSHNANLVVNGDAECITCCDYRTTATESGGQIKMVGAIDIPKINHEIADVMEGGVEAFKLRYEKYGLPPVGVSQVTTAPA